MPSIVYRWWFPRRSLALFGTLAVVGLVELYHISQHGPELARTLFSVTPSWPWERPWTVLTTVFGHRDVWHLLMNLPFVFLVGPVAEVGLTRREWWAVFVVFGGLAAVAQSAITGGTAIGASSGLAALLGVSVVTASRCGLRDPRKDASAANLVTWVLAVVTAAAFLASLGIQVARGPEDVGNLSHLFGFLLGAGYAIVRPRLRPGWDELPGCPPTDGPRRP